MKGIFSSGPTIIGLNDFNDFSIELVLSSGAHTNINLKFSYSFGSTFRVTSFATSDEIVS